MQTNLPPLRIAQDAYSHTYVVERASFWGKEPAGLTADQAALVIDIVEVRYPKLVEALKLNLAEQLRIQGRMDLDDSPGVIMARALLASLESK